jgi:hypothetical protein
VPREVFFDLEPGVIGALRASPLGELFRQGNLVNQNAGAGNTWAKRAKAHYTKARHEFCRILKYSGLCSKLRTQSPTLANAPRFVCVCGARACSLCSLCTLE